MSLSEKLEALELEAAEFLRARGWELTPPVEQPEPFVLPDEDASAEEVAQFIEDHSWTLEVDGRNIGTLDDDFIRYDTAWLMIIRDRDRIKSMLSKWTTEQLQKQRRDQGKKGSWNFTPSQRYNTILNSVLHEILRERLGERPTPTTGGMGGDGRQQ